ncbi:MAG: uroporphyrinogen decarboxylase [Bacteroidales bacterium]
MQTDPNSSLLMKTFAGKDTARPPFWFMRQAGRVLPSYRALKEKYSLWHMMNDPDIGARVTLLPVNDLRVDAAILFSDILMVPWAVGMGFEFTDKGPVFSAPLAGSSDPLAQLNPDPSKLRFVYNIIDRVIELKPAEIPLIGFCGAPLTVMCYMIQGLGKKADFPEAIRFMYENRSVTGKIIEIVTDVSIEYIKGQIEHGIDVFQLFDTHAGLVPVELYNELFMPSIRKISRVARDGNIPFIYFPKGLGVGIETVTPGICDYLSIDWQTPLDVARKIVHKDIGLQGNLDPRLLYAGKEEIAGRLEKYISFGRSNQNWIFNLGHGFIKDTPYDNAKFMADRIKNMNWGR